VKNLYYCSFDGIQIALAKIILHTDGGQLIPGAGNGLARMAVPAASALIFVPAFFLICAFSMLVAWSRIRAVEVVGS